MKRFLVIGPSNDHESQIGQLHDNEIFKTDDVTHLFSANATSSEGLKFLPSPHSGNDTYEDNKCRLKI